MPVLSPISKSAFLAVKSVRDSSNNRKYPHYVQAIVKESAKGVLTFSHLNITTDPVKADEEGYYSPEEWLYIQSQKH